MEQPAGADRPASYSYNAGMALEFFRSAGRAESFGPGEAIFAENEKGSRLFLRRDRMYLLVSGEVVLQKDTKVIGTVKPGEIFGEIGPVIDAPRSATAVAKTGCQLISLDGRQFQAALQKKPEFGLMMMALIVGRLRRTITNALAAENLTGAEALKESRVFDRKLLAELVRQLGEGAVLRCGKEKIIVLEGQAGVLMYVVVEGRVAVFIKDKLVERIGPGGVFGEMALLERAPRLASAVAETDCKLLGINRNDFLRLMTTDPAFGASLLSAVAERARFVAARL